MKYYYKSIQLKIYIGVERSKMKYNWMEIKIDGVKNLYPIIDK